MNKWPEIYFFDVARCLMSVLDNILKKTKTFLLNWKIWFKYRIHGSSKHELEMSDFSNTNPHFLYTSSYFLNLNQSRYINDDREVIKLKGLDPSSQNLVFNLYNFATGFCKPLIFSNCKFCLHMYIVKTRIIKPSSSKDIGIIKSKLLASKQCLKTVQRNLSK